VSEGTRWALARRRQLALILPVDLQYLQSSGTVAEALRPFFDATQIEGARLTLAYEGEAGTPNHRALSAPRKALLEDYLRAGMVMMGELARYAQTQDPDAGSRAITAMGRRSAILEKLGLENVEHEVPDLAAYLRAKVAENAAGDANGDGLDALPADDASSASRGNEGVERAATCSVDPSAALNTDSTIKRHSGAHGGDSHEEKDDSTNLQGADQVPAR
jgi:hypothetical protein